MSKSAPLLSFSEAYLSELTLADGIDAPSPPPSPARSGACAAATAPEPAAAPSGEDGDFFCRTSNVRFESAEALREHYHTDWYRYNLRLSARRLPPVSEAAFEALVEQASRAPAVASLRACACVTQPKICARQDGIDEELSGSDESDAEDEGDENAPKQVAHSRRHVARGARRASAHRTFRFGRRRG